MKLVLHIGSHKTGTTSIQKFLGENRKWLAAQKCFYPGEDDRLGRSVTPHHAFAHGLTGWAESDVSRSAAYARTFMERAGEEGFRTVILSAEPLYRHIVGTDRIEDLDTPDYWPRREAYLRRVINLFPDVDIEVVLVLRRQEQFAESLHLSLAERGAGLPSFEKFLTVVKPMLDYVSQIALAENIFGDVKVLSYHQLSATDDLVQAFLKAIGLPAPAMPEPIWTRRTPDARLLLWMAEQIADGQKVKVLRPFVNSVAASSLLTGTSSSLWENVSVRDRFMEQYAHDNEKIEHRYGGRSCVPFFPKPTEMFGPAILDKSLRERLTAAFGAFLVKNQT